MPYCERFSFKGCSDGPMSNRWHRVNLERAGKVMHKAKTFFIFFLCLAGVCHVEGSLNRAAAQQQEKRIALVVGDGAYAKSPLATAANDAGLVAQTLQAAGFDVVGARDLDGDA